MLMMNATAEEYRVIHAALAPGLENGSLTPVVGRELPLSDAATSHGAVLESGAYGKIVLVP
jgi:NADPH:quinone reductase-like Zn-dependent oxidoreductase